MTAIAVLNGVFAIANAYFFLKEKEFTLAKVFYGVLALVGFGIFVQHFAHVI